MLPFTAGKIPLAVGFGVSNPGHVSRIIGAGADGVIVGSAFINLTQKHKGNTDAMLKRAASSRLIPKGSHQNYCLTVVAYFPGFLIVNTDPYPTIGPVEAGSPIYL